MKLGPPIFILAVGASTLVHMLGLALLIENTKNNASFYQEKVTFNLLPHLAAPIELSAESPKPLWPSEHSNPSLRPNQWRPFTKYPTLLEPETSIAPTPPPLQKRALVHSESTIQTLIVEPRQARAASKREAIPNLKQEGKFIINRLMEARTHIAISKPPTGPSILQTNRQFLHERLSSPPSSPPTHSNSSKTAANQPKLPIGNPAQNAQQLPLIARNESIAEYKLEALGNQPPAYPRTARKQGVEGRVVLSVIVTSTGLPEHVSVYESSGAEILDDAALSAIATWTFVPAKIRNKPVDSKLMIPIRFQLEN